MHSEVYRMLGRLRPASKQHRAFTTTILGDQIADDFFGRNDLIYGLLRQCLISVTFPNRVRARARFVETGACGSAVVW
jgi:hypothetical protein